MTTLGVCVDMLYDAGQAVIFELVFRRGEESAPVRRCSTSVVEKIPFRYLPWDDRQQPAPPASLQDDLLMVYSGTRCAVLHLQQQSRREF